MKQAEMKLVDGDIMVSTLQLMKHMPEPDIEGVQAMRSMAEVKLNDAQRYRNAGFLAMSDKCGNEAEALRREAVKVEFEERLQTWREKGYFVVKVPKWDNFINGSLEGLDFNIPYKFVEGTKRQIANHKDFQALFEVPIANWVGDVPIQVLEAVETFKHSFSQLSIMFVARRSKVRELISNFVRQDPVLCGQLEDYRVILKMWGDDLEELSLTLLDPTLDTRSTML